METIQDQNQFLLQMDTAISSNSYSRAAGVRRDAFAEYFIGEVAGNLQWHNISINFCIYIMYVNVMLYSILLIKLFMFLNDLTFLLNYVIRFFFYIIFISFCWDLPNLKMFCVQPTTACKK